MRSGLFYLLLLMIGRQFPIFCQTSVQKIYLHPKAAGSDRQSKFIDSIRLIPLETKEDIGVTRSNSVDVTKNYFLIRDFSEKKILIYSKNGAFIRKIYYKRLGEDVELYYDDSNEQIVFFGDNKNYSLTSRDRLKIMLDWSNPRNTKYFIKYVIDLNDTSFAIKKGIPDQHDIKSDYHYYGDFYWQGGITTSNLFKDSLDYEFKIYQKYRLIKGFFPYNHINETRFLHAGEHIGINNTDSPGVHFITRPFYDTVYKIIGDSLFPAYQLVLPLENSLPPSFFTRPFKNESERENFRRNNGWLFHQVNNFYETAGFIYFSVSYLSNYESYIYQKSTDITLRTKNIKPDSSQYNLQLLGDYDVTRKGDRFYKALKAGDLIPFFSEHKNAPQTKEMESFLKSNPSASTPVIVEFKLRNKL